MVKVLEVPAFGIKGGIYKYIFSHLQFMDRSNMQIDFLTRNKALLDNEIIKKNAYNVKLFTSTERDDMETFIKEIESILSEGYDVIHLHNAYLLGYMIEKIALKQGVKKVVLHSHCGGMDLKGTLENKNLLALHQEKRDEITMSDATHFWACSDKATEWMFGKHIDYESVKIIRNAVDLSRYTYSEEKRSQIRAKLTIEDKKVIGHVGRFSYQKNQEFLIKVFKEIKDKNTELLLIGDGPDLNIIKERIKQNNLNDRIHIVEWVDKVEDYLSAIDLLVLPSRFEGLPLTLIEAQASGLKSLVSDDVTRMANVTGDVEYLPLEISRWVQELDAFDYTYPRLNKQDILRNAGYDIRVQAKELEAFYKS